MNLFKFLEKEIPLPLEFSSFLPFNEDDKKNMPWLKNRTRYYGISEELKKGGRAIALKGYISDSDGNSLENCKNVVLKVPNLFPGDYTIEQIKGYLLRLYEEGGKEWQLTRKRLKDCKYANPIFDFDTYNISHLGELLPLPITVQYYLENAKSLDDYLLATGQRTKPYNSTQDVPNDNWSGINDPAIWTDLARSLAVGLYDIHQRRVVHGDIWPPNIFIALDELDKPYPIFIDFGESFPLEPRGVPRIQRDHAYRAPERRDSQIIVTQSADVYSFGKLLLHLATGEEPMLSSKYKGHERRDEIRRKFRNRNPAIIKNNPFIIDIICKCVSLDPVDRPTIGEVLWALNTYVDVRLRPKSIPKISDRLESVNKTWQETIGILAAKNMNVDNILEELLEQKIHSIEEMIKGLSNGVINLIDTREHLITDLLVLFSRLKDGDRFISITHPRMWQGSALGLDGRYLSATQLATKRGASIQRVFLFSIQEVGEEWAASLSRKLHEHFTHTKNSCSKKLAELIDVEIKKYRGAIYQGDAKELPHSVCKEAIERITLVVKAYMDATIGICDDKYCDREEFLSSTDCKGLYFGILPVSTLNQVRIMKTAHPVSIFYYNNPVDEDQYLLMMTDCLSRVIYDGNEENLFDDNKYLQSKPELRGVSVFRSVLGVPEDRIKKLEQIFRQSVNLGRWISDFNKILINTTDSVAKLLNS